MLRCEASGAAFPARIQVAAHVVESQIEAHRPFGGVVPEIAARDHLTRLDPIVRAAMEQAGIDASALSEIAVTLGPGLIGALMVGVLYGRGMALGLGIPLHGINHVDAHLAPTLLIESFSPVRDVGTWLQVTPPEFPALALTVSGGHCQMSLLRSPVERRILGKTRDDACGESFDKVAKLLGLPYPGGPEIEVLARQARGGRFQFPMKLGPSLGPYEFSYSGLKTAVLDEVRKLAPGSSWRLSAAALADELKAELAHAFQEAAIGQLCLRLENALAGEAASVRSVLVAGGVAANAVFRTRLAEAAGSLPVRFAPLSLCSDNATMIGMQAYFQSADGWIQHPFPRYPESSETGFPERPA